MDLCDEKEISLYGLDLANQRSEGLAALVVQLGNLGVKLLKYIKIHCLTKVTTIPHTHIFIPES